MEIKQEQILKYGLIGREIGYSFSRSYFKDKFSEDEIQASYQNFDCTDIKAVKTILSDTTINGYNVTIPYKQDVIPLLDGLDTHAQAIGAVNTIKRNKHGKLVGYNTDFIGFKESLLERYGNTLFKSAFRESEPPLKALILGTGGASKAVVYALKSLGVVCQYVSRKRTNTTITYDDFDESLFKEHLIIVNCTPLGTYPEVDASPDIPYQYLDILHIAYDLIYNPAETLFLSKAKEQGADVCNGLRMLELQAEASWDIWRKS